MASPLETFNENVRPADLLLRVYSLLDTNDRLITEGDLVTGLRTLVNANTSEDLIVLYNSVFLGLVRESAQIPHGTLRRASLLHLLRQAVVAACTGLDTYLPSLLRTNLATVIRAAGRDFIPTSDGDVTLFFKNLSFSLDETLRLTKDPNAADYIANKIIGLIGFQYLSTYKGVHVTGKLLGLDNPWDRISDCLQRDKDDLIKVLTETVERRNDIVHRADRTRKDPDSQPREIAYVWTRHAVDTISHICHALDELVTVRLEEYRAMLGAQEGISEV